MKTASTRPFTTVAASRESAAEFRPLPPPRKSAALSRDAATSNARRHIRNTALLLLAAFELAVTHTQSPPVITPVSPSAASVGSTVTLTGSNFSPTPANNIVDFGGVRATVTATTDTLRDPQQHSLS